MVLQMTSRALEGPTPRAACSLCSLGAGSSEKLKPSSPAESSPDLGVHVSARHGFEVRVEGSEAAAATHFKVPKAHLVENAQEPGGGGRERAHAPEAVPDGQRPPHLRPTKRPRVQPYVCRYRMKGTQRGLPFTLLVEPLLSPFINERYQTRCKWRLEDRDSVL